jgi:hypothetical protein
MRFALTGRSRIDRGSLDVVWAACDRFERGDVRRLRKLDRTRPIDAAVALALAVQGATIEQPGLVYDTRVNRRLGAGLPHKHIGLELEVVPREDRAVSTEALAIVVTGAVGALGIISPAVLAMVQRKHERELARSARLHEQRLDLYRELGQFLEMERMRLERTEPKVQFDPPLIPPDPPTDETWARLHGEVGVAGSEAVRAALVEYHTAVRSLMGHLFSLWGIREQAGDANPLAQQALAAVHGARATAVERLAAVEHVMREELERL